MKKQPDMTKVVIKSEKHPLLVENFNNGVF